MRRRLLIAAAALAALWAAPADSNASSFGLTYSRQCTSCGFCVRPYNAFSSVTCGVANVDYGGGCGSGCCNKGFSGLNPACGGCGWGGCGWGGCGKGGCGLHGRIFGNAYPAAEPGDDEPGAFGSLGQQVPFFGQPAITNGYNPGCHMAWGCNNQAVNVPGYTPPPGPYVQPPNASCTNVWLPPAPFPGMYGVPYPYPVMPYLYPPPPGAQKQSHPVPIRNAGATEQPGGGQGTYLPASWYYYPGYGAQQGWYYPAYYGQYQQQ